MGSFASGSGAEGRLTALGDGRGFFRRLVAALRAVIDRVYRSHRFLVLRTELAGPPAADHLGDIVFRVATPADLDHLDEFEQYGRGSRQRKYVEEDKDWLFVACHGDRIVMTRRYSPVLPPAARDGHGLVPRVVQLGPAQAWGADSFCLPEYRNRKIGRHMGFFADRFMASLGYTQLFSAIPAGNDVSIRMNLQIGRRPLYSVSYVRLLFWERLRVSREFPEQQFRAVLK
jgi:GNAT superfamily N-acetyltransferase